MKNNNHKLGFFAYQQGLSAENIAANYLIKHEWHILHRRFHNPYGEIDLIATKRNWLLFVEVKARKKLNDALNAISLRQQKRLVNAASYYLEYHQPEIENVRFDLIAINQQGQIEHLKNIILTES